MGGIEISHLEAITTDGKTQRRIFWLDITNNGVYLTRTILAVLRFFWNHACMHEEKNAIDETIKSCQTIIEALQTIIIEKEKILLHNHYNKEHIEKLLVEEKGKLKFFQDHMTALRHTRKYYEITEVLSSL